MTLCVEKAQSILDWFKEENPKCLIIGEVAQTHDGSLGAAHAYIDAVANAGADAIKFQTHIAPCLASGPIAGAARGVVLAARNLDDSSWSLFAKACAAPYLFNDMERGFDSGEEPVGEINRLLENLASFFTIAAKSGFGKLASPTESEGGSTKETSGRIEEVTGEHYGRLFENFSTGSYWDEPARLLKLRLERNGIDLNELPLKRALDDGCGNGRYTAAWKLIGARQAVGVDIPPLNIATARRRVEQSNINGVSFEQGNALQLPFPDNSFDIVFSNGVLHHTVDWRAGVAECVRTLKTGGLGWLYLFDLGRARAETVRCARPVRRQTALLPHQRGRRPVAGQRDQGVAWIHQRCSP